MPGHAEPSLCKFSAITATKRQTVIALQNMRFLQLKLEIMNSNLNTLNHQITFGYNSNDAGSVNYFNDLIAKYNDVVGERNKLSKQYNQLKDLFNALVNKISPSRNTTFVTCLNSELSVVEATTTNQNGELLNTNIETLRH